VCVCVCAHARVRVCVRVHVLALCVKKILLVLAIFAKKKNGVATIQVFKTHRVLFIIVEPYAF